MLLKKILQAGKPPLFEQGTSQMWTDDYISGQMLQAHLDPDTHAASRKPEIIDRSVSWIDAEICGRNTALEILDLGCGPGMYSNRLARLGYKVTGIDFSHRSIGYAQQQAIGENLNVSYFREDYLSFDIPGLYDLMLMIYCDFGVIDDVNREKLLARAYHSLKPGGVFLFDVFHPFKYKNHVNSTSWSAMDSGFWRPGPHLCLNSSYWYEESRVHLDQAIVLDESGTLDIYNIWDRTFTVGELEADLQKHGFDSIEFRSDVTGTGYNPVSDTLCVLARKR